MTHAFDGITTYLSTRLRFLSGRFLSIHSKYLKALAQQEHQVLTSMCGHVIRDDIGIDFICATLDISIIAPANMLLYIVENVRSNLAAACSAPQAKHFSAWWRSYEVSLLPLLVNSPML